MILTSFQSVIYHSLRVNDLTVFAVIFGAFGPIFFALIPHHQDRYHRGCRQCESNIGAHQLIESRLITGIV